MSSKIGGGGGPASAIKSATTTVNVSAATAPATGQVLTATDSTHATWQTASGGVGGSTGATDNALLRSDGVGGATLQSTGIIITDSNEMHGQVLQKLNVGTSLSQGMSGQVCSALPGGGSDDYFLPTAPLVGTFYIFTVPLGTDDITIHAGGTEVIYLGAAVSTAGGTIASSTTGSMVLAVYAKAGKWLTIFSGTWTAA